MKKLLERLANQKSETQLEGGGLEYWLEYYIGSPPDPEKKYPQLTLEMLHEFMDELDEWSKRRRSD